MWLREATPRARALGLGACAAIGALAAALVLLGNPGNMGLCGACFLRDVAGSLGLFAAGPQIFRPELMGLMLGALLWKLSRGELRARSGSHAATRLFLGVWMGIAALVFLGCPFRLLQRLGGGDLHAWLALPGFLVGVFVARRCEQRGYKVGTTSEVPLPVGLLGPLFFALIGGAFLLGALRGPLAGDPGGPPHAPWMWALVLALPAGTLLSASGFCAISAARQVFGGPRPMLLACGALIASYALVLALGGSFRLGFASQPIAHGEWLWNALSTTLLGLCGALAGGCPVRQIAMSGEGNGDAFVTTMGILLGGAIAHGAGLASSAAGTTAAGRVAVLVGLLLVALYGAWMARLAQR